MSKKDELINLIASLDKNETGYFVKYAKRHGLEARNDYLWLFERIKKQKNVDWQQIEKSIPADRFKIGLTKAKLILYNQILRSMSLYSEDHSIDNKIRSLLTGAVFLKKKRLMLQYRRQVAKARKLALKHEDYKLVLHISTYDWNIRSKAKNDKTIHQYYENQIKYLALIAQGEQINYLASQFQQEFLRYWARKTKDSRLKLEALMEQLSSYDFNKISFWSKQTILYSQNHYHVLLDKDINKAAATQEEAMRLYQEYPHFIQSNALAFVATFSHLCSYSLITKDYTKFKYYFSIADSISIPAAKLHLKSCQYLMKAYYYLAIQENEAMHLLVAEINKWLSLNKKWINSLTHHYLLTSIVLYYYTSGNYDECSKYAGRELNNLKSNSPNVAKILFFLLCFSYYKLKEYNLLESYMYRFEYYLRERKDDLGIDLVLLNVVKILIISKDVEEKLTAQLKKYRRIIGGNLHQEYALLHLDRIIEAEIQ